MKTVLVLFAIFAIANLARADSSEESDEIFENLDKIKSPHLKQLLKKVELEEWKRNATAEIEKRCPGASQNITKAVASMIECGDAVDQSLTVCAALKSSFVTCTAPLITVIDNCLPEKSKGLPDLVVKSITAGFKYACSLSGEQLFEFWNDCALPTEKNQKEAEACETSLKPKLESLQNDLSSKKVCSIGNDAKSCLNTYISQSCSNEITKNVFNGMVDAILQPCNEV